MSLNSKLLVRAAVGAAAVIAIVCIVCAVFVARQRRAYIEAEDRLVAGLVRIDSGDAKPTVTPLLGPPTYTETQLVSPYSPADVQCRRRAQSVLIYQPPVTALLDANRQKRRTVLVFVGGDGRVICVERTTAMRVLHR